MARPTLDILQMVKKLISDDGISDTTLKQVDGSHECVYIALAVSPDPQRYFDGGSSRDYALTILVKRESEQQAMSEALTIADLLGDSSLDSANGSYLWSCTEVGTPRSINWDEAGYFVWAVSAAVHTSRKD